MSRSLHTKRTGLSNPIRNHLSRRALHGDRADLPDVAAVHLQWTKLSDHARDHVLRTELPKFPAQYLRRTELSNCQWYNLPCSELHAFGSELPNRERYHLSPALCHYTDRFKLPNKNIRVLRKRSHLHQDRPELSLPDGSGKDVRWGHDVRGSLPSALT